MTLLSIHLREGFDGDAVVIEVNGAEVYRRDDVTTRMQIGLADICEIDVAGGSALVRLELPRRNQSEQIDVPMTVPSWLAATLTRAGSLELRISTTPLGYV